MLPYFAPEIVPKVPAPNVVRHNLDETDPRANVRAVIEAQALSSSIHARWMGVEISSLYVTGGASANAEILRVYANVHNCPVHRFETTNSGALGAALRAAHAHQSATGTSWQETVGPFTEPMTGSTIEPDPAAVATYSNIIGAYESLERTHTDN
jgi:xylulokinase